MDLGDFLRQIPIQILLAPFVFGGLYIVLMAYIIQRSRKRKQAERERADALIAGRELPPPPPKRSFLQNLPLGNFLRGELPDRPLESAGWTVPSELRNLPEPDLDMLAMPTYVDQSQEESSSHAMAEGMPPASPAKVSPALDYNQSSAAPVRAQRVAKVDREMQPIAENRDEPVNRDVVEVLRVYRHLNDGGLIIEIGNRRYNSSAELYKADLTGRFTGIVSELAAMTDELRGADSELAQTDGTEKPSNNVGAPRIGLLKGQAEPPKRDFIHSFARAAMAQTDVQDSSAGIADAVEEFLQFKLSNTPQFAERSIHIRSGRDHAIRIEVDGHYYDAIGDVVDPDVRDYLFGMMREWEARH